jgi:hypothetical protein
MKENTIFLKVFLCYFLALAPVSYLLAKSSHTDQPDKLVEKTPHVDSSSAVLDLLKNQLETQRDDQIFIAKRLDLLDKTLIQSSKRSDETAFRTSWMSLVGIGMTILLGWLGLWHQQKLNESKERAEITNAYMEWTMKQISEFYGPLRALLGQSNAMYRQMNHVLINAAPEIFRFEKMDGQDFDNLVFQIFKDGQWSRFRTVKNLEDVYNKGFNVEPYFTDVVNVGEQIANLIRDKTGYLRAEDKDLVAVLGDYLAHFSVLKRLHEAGSKNEKINATKADENATFPIQMQSLVDDGFQKINAQIIKWRDKGLTKL